MREILVMLLLLSPTAQAAEIPNPAEARICRFYSEFSNPDKKGETVAAGYRGQVFTEDSGKLCLQDRADISKSSAMSSLVCSEHFGAYDVFPVKGYGEYEIEIMTLFKVFGNKYDQQVMFRSPWSDYPKPGEKAESTSPLKFLTQGGACKKVNAGVLRYAAARLALKARGPTADPKTSTFAREQLTNPQLRSEFGGRTIIHPSGLTQYTSEQITDALRAAEQRPQPCTADSKTGDPAK
jgi:hypothetical protein